MLEWVGGGFDPEEFDIKYIGSFNGFCSGPGILVHLK
jgi:hypothetical protein